MTTETVDLTKLRAPFKPEYVGKLPRVTCRECNDRNAQCSKHVKAECATCGNWLGKHIHLDYVGHADVTIRLLEVDPEWSWAPKATDADPELLKAAMASGDPEIVHAVIENAPPKFDTDRNGNPVGLWIKLTVGGVTRLGVGSCPSGQNDAEKVLIGDALRNAAMRFGVAVELWAKGDRADPTAENATASGGQADRQRPAPARAASQQAAAPEGESAWLKGAMQAAPTAGLEACTALWQKSVERVADGTLAKADAAKLQNILRPRMLKLKAAPASPVAADLDPDDPWAQTVEELGDEDEANAALEELAELVGSGAMGAERFAAILEAIQARFPQAGTAREKAA